MIKTKKLVVKEHDVQKQILEYLSLKRIFHYRNNSGMVFSEYKGRKRAFRVGVVGGPDIVCVLPIMGLGVMLGIEVKSINGKQLDTQKQFQYNLEKAGGIYLLVRSLDETIKGLENAKNKALSVL